jgi:hypothetical protein
MDSQWLKRLLLAFLAVACFAFTWGSLATALNDSRDLEGWIVPVLTAGLGTVFLSLLAMVGSNKWFFLGTNFAILTCYLILMPKDWYVAAGGAAFFLLSFLFEQRIKSDEKTRADFSLHRIIRSSVSVMVYALLLMVGFNIYVKAATGLEKNPQEFYGRVGHYAARSLDQVPANFGEFDPKDPLLKDAVAGFISESLEKQATKYQKFLPIAFAILAVALLRTIGFIFVWITMLFAQIIFRLLLFLKFFRIEPVQVEVRKLQI